MGGVEFRKKIIGGLWLDQYGLKLTGVRGQ